LSLNFNVNDSIPITTTTSIKSSVDLSKVRGFSVELLCLLIERPRTLYQISTTTSIHYRKVYRYLYRLRQYGLVNYINGYWCINVENIHQIIYILENRLNYIEYRKYIKQIYSIMTEIGQKYDRNMTDSRKCKIQFLQMSNIKPSINDAISWLKSKKCSPKEIEVVVLLARHLNESGQPFILAEDIYDLASKLNVPPNSLQTVISHLRELGAIYLCRDVTGKWKVGLKKFFIEKYNLRCKT